jgi:hypothetical protein
MGHVAEILDVLDLDLGYDAAKFPYQSPQQKIRSTSRAGLLRGLGGNISRLNMDSGELRKQEFK